MHVQPCQNSRFTIRLSERKSVHLPIERNHVSIFMQLKSRMQHKMTMEETTSRMSVPVRAIWVPPCSHSAHKHLQLAPAQKEQSLWRKAPKSPMWHNGNSSMSKSCAATKIITTWDKRRGRIQEGKWNGLQQQPTPKNVSQLQRDESILVCMLNSTPDAVITLYNMLWCEHYSLKIPSRFYHES